MTAQIKGFITRADAELRKPNSVSRNITPSSGGVAGHYGGPSQPAAEPGTDHAKCITTWRNWQTYHMQTKGWADIAYTGGFCNHGYAFAGRGAGVRTAANGTNTGNQTFYAVTWIGGEGQTPTKAAFDAFEWWVNELRTKGSAGTAVKSHNYFKPTGCPGNPVRHHCTYLDGKQIQTPASPAPFTPITEVLSPMYLLVKSDDAPAVFAVAPGTWFHINGPQLHAIRKAKAALNGGVVQVLAPDELENLSAVVAAGG